MEQQQQSHRGFVEPIGPTTGVGVILQSGTTNPNGDDDDESEEIQRMMRLSTAADDAPPPPLSETAERVNADGTVTTADGLSLIHI